MKCSDLCVSLIEIDTTQACRSVESSTCDDTGEVILIMPMVPVHVKCDVRPWPLSIMLIMVIWQ